MARSAPQFLIDLENAYGEVALELAELMGVEIASAEGLLSLWLGGFNPGNL